MHAEVLFMPPELHAAASLGAFRWIGNTSWTSHPNCAFRKRPFVVINDTFQPTLCDFVGEREQPRNPVRPRRNIRPMGRDKLTDMKVMIHHVWQQLADGSD